MSIFVASLVLLSAVLHAAWNAVLHGGRDRLLTTAIMNLAMASVAGLAALIAPAPEPASWPYLAASAVLQVAYSLLLVKAYQHGDLAETYPLARGSSPLLIALAALVFAGERLSFLAFAGVILISAGIVALSYRGGQMRLSSTIAALATGCVIAAYSVVDGIGIRLSQSPFGYVAWLQLSWCLPLGCVLLIYRRQALGKTSARQLSKASMGGVVAIAAYGTTLWAFQFGPLGPISALRETSVVFALIIGHYFLREPITGARILACCAIVAGMTCLGLRL